MFFFKETHILNKQLQNSLSRPHKWRGPESTALLSGQPAGVRVNEACEFKQKTLANGVGPGCVLAIEKTPHTVLWGWWAMWHKRSVHLVIK